MMTMKFLNVVTLLFIAFKLMGHISWSWWVVLSPTMIPTGVLVFALALIGADTVNKRNDEK